MLSPGQVAPFLMHEMRVVRNHARSYFNGGTDSGPVTADDLWRAVDKFPDDLGASLYTMTQVPSTPDSLDRILRELNAGHTEAVREKLCRALNHCDLAHLSTHRERFLTAETIPTATRDHLQKRLALLDQPVAAQQLWDRLIARVDLFAETDDGPSEEDDREMERLLEALARYREFAVELAPRILANPFDEYSDHDFWARNFAVRLAGLTRCAAVVDQLVEMVNWDDDYDWDYAEDSLIRIDDPSTVAKLAARYRQFPDGDWGPQMAVASLLGRFLRPDAEAALFELLKEEKDGSFRALLAQSLCDLCANLPEVLAALHQMEVAGDYDGLTANLFEGLAPLCVMTGFAPPELPEWLAELEAVRGGEAEDEEEIGEGMEDSLGESDYTKDWENWRKTGTVEPYVPPLPPEVDPYTTIVDPIRRDGPKVGRNDPCPCGSGKKYKKCCGK